MGAPFGNQFWKARTKHGRDKIFASPELLWESCEEYFQWVEDNPLWENRVAQYQGTVIDMPVAKMRAMTVDGICLFLDIHPSTWYEWRSAKNDFSDIIDKAESVIRSQKFAGAAADLLNANIIARDLNLTDKREDDSKEDMASILSKLIDKLPS